MLYVGTVFRSGDQIPVGNGSSTLFVRVCWMVLDCGSACTEDVAMMVSVAVNRIVNNGNNKGNL